MVFDWKTQEPDFVNEEGFEWYLDKYLTKWCNNTYRPGKPLNAHAYLVVKNDKSISYVVIQGKEVIADNKSFEAILSKIDILRLVEEG